MAGSQGLWNKLYYVAQPTESEHGNRRNVLRAVVAPPWSTDIDVFLLPHTVEESRLVNSFPSVLDASTVVPSNIFQP
jgi:hypothetical protein